MWSRQSQARRCSRWRLPKAGVSPDDVWTAAHVDEDWNMQFWGRDELALERRAYRRKRVRRGRRGSGCLAACNPQL